MRILIIIIAVFTTTALNAKTIYLNKVSGDNHRTGLTESDALKDLEALKKIDFEAGDSILLAANQVFDGMLSLEGIQASQQSPLIISTYVRNGVNDKAIINGKGNEAAIRIVNCSGIKIEKLIIQADGGGAVIPSNGLGEMRCGILVLTNEAGDFGDIVVDQVEISDVFYPNHGFSRGKEDVKTANGKQPYGWGIRVICSNEHSTITNISVSNSSISNVGHTGIKFTVQNNKGGHRIQNIQVFNNQVTHTGGPGIQMSGIKNGHIYGNKVDHSGSITDSRKWGRGSGLWTWGSENVLIEKNRFTNANGPADSAGAHIDFNCRNVVMQYNYSANNAGGFCEILGNNYNCAYRYNISVDDGHRVKGEKDAFQEGKIFWLSGYQGAKKRNGPFNSYFYNNTIYVSEEFVAKIAVDKASAGVLIANNIFHIKGQSKAVLGDQYKPEIKSEGTVHIPNVLFSNNVFLKSDNWPSSVLVQPSNIMIGDVVFETDRLDQISSFIPKNTNLVQDKGMEIVKIPGDELGLLYGLVVKNDILGNPIKGIPDIGAIEVHD